MIKDKIKSWNDIRSLAAALHANAKKIVFTNGCFDILHAGHVVYLEQARSMGDVLILGLNSDASIRRLKGDQRPVVNENDRALVVAALAAVDFVVVFEQDTPYELISLIQPDLLVKGGDWLPECIVGSDIVLAQGGEVRSIDYLDGSSTSGIIDRIRKGT
jgi:D-beta-D-heptose 7-phosphate kinase/D-beta-D-heptose 1-phosphate adenosyltransferase